MSRLWSLVIDLVVDMWCVKKEVRQLASEVKELRAEIHPTDLSAVVWHVGIPRGEKNAEVN